MTAPDPLLAHCRRLFLRDYEVWINIGVHDFEKRAEQRVVINVDLYVPLAQNTPRNDRIDLPEFVVHVTRMTHHDLERGGILSAIERRAHLRLERPRRIESGKSRKRRVDRQPALPRTLREPRCEPLDNERLGPRWRCRCDTEKPLGRIT